jgi:hypothetical protein
VTSAPTLGPLPIRGILREISPKEVPVVIAKSVEYLDARGTSGKQFPKKKVT